MTRPHKPYKTRSDKGQIRIDYTGHRFLGSRLTVVRTWREGNTTWAICACDCGTAETRPLRMPQVKNGDVKNCGTACGLRYTPPSLYRRPGTGACAHGHAWTPKNTRVYREQRVCRACDRERQRRTRQAAKQQRKDA